MVRRYLPRIFFLAYGAGALLLAIAEFLNPESVSTGTNWGSSPGWLREMSCFNVFVAVICGLSIRELSKSNFSRLAAGALAALSLLLAANNFIAFRESGLARHLQGAMIHVLAMIAGFATARALENKGNYPRG